MDTLKQCTSQLVTLGLLFSIMQPLPVSAATSPSLGVASTYSVLAGSTITNTGATTISGNVGISPGIGAAPHYSGFGTVTLGGVIEDASAAALAAQGAKDTAFSAVAAQTCTTDYGAVTQELAGLILEPGVYCATSFHLTNGVLTLNGSVSGVWIFKSASDLIVTGSASEIVFTGGGQSCNVWFNVVSTATFDAGSAFVGNILANTSITFAAGASLEGRALAGTAEVTFDSTSITAPTCASAAPAAPPAEEENDSITVIKQVINDNGGTAVFSDFPLFLNGVSVDSGERISFPTGTYTVTETNTLDYTASFSGDCDANGVITHTGTRGNDVCIITNDDIGAVAIVPPLIEVIKVPSPLALPDGPGSVEYGFTINNIGTVPMSDVTVIDDSCTPLQFIGGDSNNDDALDVTETWYYACETTLQATHTNIVIATGWANGVSAIDIAEATVVVDIALIPPLIHVTKIPNPLALLSAGGSVTYTETITNPGTVALDNVELWDDKCSPVEFISGDTNDDGLLDTDESWIYTCTQTLTGTTTNIATATGEANGFTVEDTAIATVTVATAEVPALPDTGNGAAPAFFGWIVGLAALLGTGAAFFICLRRTNVSL